MLLSFLPGCSLLCDGGSLGVKFLEVRAVELTRDFTIICFHDLDHILYLKIHVCALEKMKCILFLSLLFTKANHSEEILHITQKL